MQTRQTRVRWATSLSAMLLSLVVAACTTEEGTTPTCVNDLPHTGQNVDNGCNQLAICVDGAGVAQPAATCCKDFTGFDYDLCLYNYGAGPAPTGGGGASAASGTGGAGGAGSGAGGSTAGAGGSTAGAGGAGGGGGA